MVTVIKLVLDSPELAVLKQKEFNVLMYHRRDITNEISKIIDIDARSIELLKPMQTKKGLYLIFHIRTMDTDKQTEIMKLIRQEAKSGYLVKAIRDVWSLRKVPKIESIETKELRPDVNLEGDSNDLAAIINIKNKVYSQRQLKWINRESNISYMSHMSNNNDDRGTYNNVQLQLQLSEMHATTKQSSGSNPIGNNGLTQGPDIIKNTSKPHGERSIDEINEVITHFNTISDPHTDQYYQTKGGQKGFDEYSQTLSNTDSNDDDDDNVNNTHNNKSNYNYNTNGNINSDDQDDDQDDQDDGLLYIGNDRKLEDVITTKNSIKNIALVDSDNDDNENHSGAAAYIQLANTNSGQFEQPPMGATTSVNLDSMLSQDNDKQMDMPQMEVHGAEGHKSSDGVAIPSDV